MSVHHNLGDVYTVARFRHLIDLTWASTTHLWHLGERITFETLFASHHGEVLPWAY